MNTGLTIGDRQIGGDQPVYVVAELSANHRTSQMFLDIARKLTGHGEVRSRSSLLAPIREMFTRRPSAKSA